MLKERTYPTGGQFLLDETDPSDAFTPEDFDDDQRMIASTVREFVETHVKPVLEEAEFGKNVMLGKKLLHEAGEAGILMVDVPERFEGLGAPKATSMIVSEYLAGSGSFSVTYGGHASIGTLPIVYFGTEAQKAKYLPELAHGRLIGAYALTEPGSGSDALAAKTTARLAPEGDVYLLNGTKQYISNAAFADLFIVFAKIDGDKFTAFIVPRDTPGLSLGAEERKMGIRGSSTRAVILEDARVPVENVLGDIGKGHVIAFNILNVGRFKLGAGTLGGCKLVMREAIPYVKNRKQFGKALSEFGLIRAKIADVAARTFVCESMVYRTAGLMDQAIEGLDPGAADFERKVIDAIEEFSIECSMIKVFGSESLDFACDEGLQMLGGYGFCEDYPMERHYRDQRINRIFEGTNEINRMLATGMVLKKALKGELPFFAAAGKVAQEIAGPPAWEEASEGGFLDAEAKRIASMKKAVLATVGFAAQKHGEAIKDAQEILSDAADMLIETYACESGLLRARKKALADGEAAAAAMADMLTLYLHDAIDRIAKWARNIAAASAEGDELRMMIAALRRLTKHDPVNRSRLHDAIASRVIEAEQYVA